jgi:methylated-DNA-[protein]-cysteine S-methyltransferase
VEENRHQEMPPVDLHTTTLDTPVGPFTLLVDEDGGVCAAGFTGGAEPLRRRLDPPRRSARVRRTHGDPGGVAAAVRAYFAGELEALEGLTVTQPGDPSRQGAWRALRSVPAGRTISYRRLGELAGLADPAVDPFGAQAAGAACAGNNVAVIVPCHRVLRADGRLSGYGWGVPRKRWLLGHESALPTLLDGTGP